MKLNRQHKTKLKVGDQVQVIAGKDKGKVGNIISIERDNNRAKVENVNIVSKAQKENPNIGQKGGIVKIEAFVNLSNVAIHNPETNQPDRVKYKILADGKKVRIYAKNNEQIDTAV